ncbi:DUF1835 domain-containing protein [Geomicrobium sp. JCM 19039]|uniref:DUF1835 domain-containing protein n=1 Tax=Geomicrobium sp. JCM 19039 TaxID=1460636 RepID=UPI00045F3046|nr:DUF1835 domain-containing protein [Geomicrobium sp. JCM 19039]GAK14017.1 hypothetical protein JCM19039_3910 [Geomicrobium sp. JCM 19039]
MKFHANYPYLYMMKNGTDSNVHVFEVKDTSSYYTIVQFMDDKGTSREIPWDAYERVPGQSLEQFDHRQATVASGGASLAPRDVHKIVCELNRMLQQHGTLAKPDAPVHISASEGDAGVLQIGLAGERTVLVFPDQLQYGPVAQLETWKGIENRHEWLVERFGIHPRESEYERLNLYDRFRLQLQDIPSHVPIYVWHNREAGGETARKLILAWLQDTRNETYTVPFKVDDRSDVKNIKTTLMSQLAENAEPVAKNEGHLLAWKTFSRQVGELRIVNNGQLLTVPVSAYDEEIERAVDQVKKVNDEGFASATEVIQTVLANGEPHIQHLGFLFFEYRIYELIIHQKRLIMSGNPRRMNRIKVKRVTEKFHA